MSHEDTIAAIATPAGRGGIGIVRLSGADALTIAAQILRPPVRADSVASEWLVPWRAKLAGVVGENGAVIDQALVTAFHKPHSYTAEDMVEIACHGSPVVLRCVLERCLAAGARLAEPGEFTMRAFLNGRIDLAQAEAVRDLIEARTLYQAKVAAQQVEGSVAQWIAPIKRDLTELIAYLEAGIDFAEDDVSVLPAAEIGARLEKIDAPLARLLDSFTAGRIIHDGLTLALVGRPNVGKSSLFNRLLEQDRAIVTAAPGTTRDLVSETVEIEGIPLRFVDTAGIREACDEAEAIGVRKSLAAAADSDLTLLVLDGAAEQTAEDWSLLHRVAEKGKWIAVVNKCDLPLHAPREQLQREISAAAASEFAGEPVRVQFVSALKGTGLTELRHAIVQQAAPALAGERETQVLTSMRQQQLVSAARDSLRAARQASANAVPHEMLLLDLYAALRHLDAMTGATTTEDILTKIFSSFCIGK